MENVFRHWFKNSWSDYKHQNTVWQNIRYVSMVTDSSIFHAFASLASDYSQLAASQGASGIRRVTRLIDSYIIFSALLISILSVKLVCEKNMNNWLMMTLAFFIWGRSGIWGQSSPKMRCILRKRDSLNKACIGMESKTILMKRLLK